MRLTWTHGTPWTPSWARALSKLGYWSRAQACELIRAGCVSRVVVGSLPKERMDRMGMPTDIFTSRAPDDVIDALTKAGFKGVRVERPEPTTPWSVLVATR